MCGFWSISLLLDPSYPKNQNTLQRIVGKTSPKELTKRKDIHVHKGFMLKRTLYLAVSALELPAEKVAEPALQERRHPAHEEEPDPPAGRPEAAARPLPHRPSVEAVVDHVLQVFAHADLLHQLVLVPVHAWNTVWQ